MTLKGLKIQEKDEYSTINNITQLKPRCAQRRHHDGYGRFLWKIIK